METVNNTTDSTTPIVFDNQSDTGMTPKKNNKTRLIVIGSLCLAAALASFLLIRQKLAADEALRQELIHSGTLHAGIFIDGVDVGGMTPAQAAAALQPVEHAMREKISFDLHLDDIVIPVTTNEIKIAFDSEAVIAEAMLLGREGTLKELQAELLDISETHRTFSISYSVVEDALQGFVTNLATQYDTLPINAEYHMLIERVPYDDARQKDETFVIAAAATTQEQRMEYVADIPGVQIDQKTLHDELLKKMQTNDHADYEIPFQSTEAELTLEKLQQLVVLRGAASTSFAKSPYNRATRIFNIQKAASLINGMVLQPGEEFSTNGTLGDRTYAGGWKPAPAIVRGRSEDQAGGGVCQVSSTLYNAVLKADLGIVYRQGHSARLSYIDGGLDATIDSGHIDFVWKNSTNSPIYIYAWTDIEEQRVYFEIYGEPFPAEYDTIELSSKRISTLSPPGEMKYIVDYTKPAGYSEVFVEQKSGAIWEAYKTYKKGDTVVKTETIDKTTYKAYAGETIVGPPATLVPVM